MLRAIENRTLGRGSVAGSEYFRNMNDARFFEDDGTVRWVEVCYCAEPLEEERPYWERFFELTKIQDAHDRRKCRDKNGEEAWGLRILRLHRAPGAKAGQNRNAVPCFNQISMSDYEFLPYDDRTQMLQQIEKYTPSFTRVPESPLFTRPLTLTDLTGPTELSQRWNVGKLDLCRASDKRALGQLISLEGRVTDEDGSPAAGVVMEIWQANASGKYVHETDDHIAPLDPNFTGQGRLGHRW